MKNTLLAILIVVGVIIGSYYIGDIVTSWFASDSTILDLAQAPVILSIVRNVGLGFVYVVLGLYVLGCLGALIIIPMLAIKDRLDERDKKRKFPNGTKD